MKWGVRKFSLKDHIKKRRQKTETVKKALGEDYEYYKSLHGKRGTERVYDRAQKKGISYEKSSWLESARSVGMDMLNTAATAGVMATSYYVANKKRVTRGKQWLNRHAPKLEAKAYNYNFITSVGNGIDILQKVGR